jgi:chromate transporter
LGYLTNGLRGALLALIAIIIPPLIVLLLDRIYQQIRNHPAVIGFIQGLSLAVEGIFVLILLSLMQNAGADWRSIGIAVIAMVLAATRRIPVIGIVVLAALAGNVIWTNH